MEIAYMLGNEMIYHRITGYANLKFFCTGHDVTDPKILFLDEPTLGLDVKTTKFIIDKLLHSNNTIFLTSHNMDIVEKLCTNIAFIDNGKIIKIGSKEEIRNILQKRVKIFIGIDENRSKLKKELEHQGFITTLSIEENGLNIELLKRNFYNKLFPIIEKYKITKIQVIELSIEDLFLEIVDQV